MTVRTSGDPIGVQRSLAAAIKTIDPDLPINLADALLAPRVVDDGDVGDAELPVEVAAAEVADDLGQPVPESKLVSESKSSLPQQTQR